MESNFITILISSVTGVVTYLVGHRRAKKEIEGLALTNVEKSLTIYNSIISDLRNQVEILLTRVNELETKIDELKEENHTLKEMLRNRK